MRAAERLRRGLSALALGAACLLPAPAAWTAPATVPPLEPLLAQAGLAGAVLALVDDGEVHIAAAGHARLPGAQAGDGAAALPMQPSHRMHTGSVAKPVLALAVLRLATLGRLSLDDPLDRHLPDLPVDNPWAATQPLRVRHLLDHSAGLDDVRLWHLFNREHGARLPLEPPLAEAWRQHTDVLRLRFAPGTRTVYSNLGFTLAGALIERLTGEPFERWTQRELLAPLGMHDSSFAFRSPQGAQADPMLAWGHLDGGRPQATLPVAVRPAAQFSTTAADMARLIGFLLDGSGRLPAPPGAAPAGSAPFIDPALLAGMGRAERTDAARAGLAAGYALGLARRDRHGAVGLCHEGSTVGFRAMLCLYPADRLTGPGASRGKGYFVAFNTDSEDGGHVTIYAALTEALGVSSPATPTLADPGPALAAAQAWNGRYALAPSRMQAYAFADWLGDTRRWQADPAAGGARWERGGRVQAMSPTAPGLFRPADRQEAALVLLQGPGGERLISDGLQTWRRLPAGLWQATWAVMLAGAAGTLYWALRPGRWRRPAPAAVAVWAVVAAALAVAAQGWTALGERHLDSVALALASAALPLACLWQALACWRRRARLDSAAALAVLPASAVLAWHGLLPLALWR